MNKWMISGRVTKDIETTPSETGNSRTVVNVAVTRSYKNKETGASESDFFQCVAFGKAANYINDFVNKGDLIELVVVPRNSNYEKDGQKIYTQSNNIESINKLLNAPKKDMF
jgi:single-strand DNA-binding protein